MGMRMSRGPCIYCLLKILTAPSNEIVWASWFLLFTGFYQVGDTILRQARTLYEKTS